MYSVLTFWFLLLPLFSLSQLSTIELEVKSVPEPAVRDSVVDAWNQSQPGYQNLPAEAKQLLYWTNYSRNYPEKFWDSIITPVLRLFPPLQVAEAESLRNDLVRAGPLPMFILNKKLVKAAQTHAADIGQNKAAPGHSSTNGTNFETRMNRLGIKHCATENISISSQSILLSVILLYLDIYLPELGHRKALLNPNLREIGVGSALYGKDQYFMVQDFACTQ